MDIKERVEKLSSIKKKIAIISMIISLTTLILLIIFLIILYAFEGLFLRLNEKGFFLFVLGSISTWFWLISNEIVHKKSIPNKISRIGFLIAVYSILIGFLIPLPLILIFISTPINPLFFAGFYVWSVSKVRHVKLDNLREKYKVLNPKQRKILFLSDAIRIVSFFLGIVSLSLIPFFYSTLLLYFSMINWIIGAITNLIYGSFLDKSHKPIIKRGRFEPHYYIQEGQIKLKKKDNESSVKFYEGLLEKDPNWAVSLNNLEFIHLQNEEYDKAISILETYYQKDENVWGMLGSIYNTMGEYSEAIDVFERGLKINPESNYIWNEMAFSYNKSGNHIKSMEAARNALIGKPEFANPWNHLGFSYYKQGDFEKAMELINKSIGLDPNYARARFNLAIILIALERHDKAIEAIDKCLEIDSTFEEAIKLRDKIIKSEGIKEKKN